MDNWLITGDISIKYQAMRDLMNKDDLELRQAMISQGWVYEFLKRQNKNGHWGSGFYSPKWISTHYTLLDLRSLNSPLTQGIMKAIRIISNENRSSDGSINPSKEINNSDVCINGMFLNYASYYGLEEELLEPVVDFIISQIMDDGGWNCRLNRSGAVHSSVHTTICTLEGIETYKQSAYTYRLDELCQMQEKAEAFLLIHHLYKSDKTGKIIHKNMTMLSYPYRWKYSVMRALDYFRYAKKPYDSRMKDGIELLKSKERKDGTYPLQAKHPGQFHFEMEKCGQSSRMTTLIITRILDYYREV